MNERLAGLGNVALIEPFDYSHFARLLGAAHLMLTDSGGMQVLAMRTTTERPERLEAGTARLVATHSGRIVAEAEHLLDDPLAYETMSRAHNPFGDGKAGRRIVGALNAPYAPQSAGRLAPLPSVNELRNFHNDRL